MRLSKLLCNHFVLTLNNLEFRILRSQIQPMRKHLLFLILLVSGISFGQCTIDYSQTVPGLYPDTMPVGYVNTFYDEDISFVLPTDTQGVDFTNFHILSIGLPVGLTWECSNSANGCNYDPQVDQYGCVRVYGTPLLAGQYQVDVTVIADLTIASGIPTTFQVFMEILPNNTPISNGGFSMTGATGCAPQTVDFTNNNPGLLLYNWDFGNGTTSTLENPPPQVYTTPGDFVVTYEAYDTLDTINVYTLTDVTIQSMSGYGEGFPSFDDADAYYIIYENGVLFSQSSVILDTDPPVSWTTSLILDPANTYTIEIWENEPTPAEILFGADDYMGIHTMNLAGCLGCAAGTASIDYIIDNQVILPTPFVLSVDTVHVGTEPAAPVIAYDAPSYTLDSPDLGLNYQWYLNGNPIAGSTDTSHVVDSSGYYQLAAINNTGCVAFSDSMLIVFCSPNYEPNIEITSGVLQVTNAGTNEIQWYLDGNILANDTLSLLVPTSNGYYSVQVTDEFGCVYTSDSINVVAGVDEMNLLSWTVYPNPASDMIRVKGDQLHTLESLQITDMMGRVVLERRSIEDGQSIDISGLKSGPYVIRFVHQGTQLTRRLLKQN